MANLSRNADCNWSGGKYLLVIYLVVLALLPLSVSAQLIISEAMINEPGGEVELEWIELYNADSDSLMLADFLVIEAIDTTIFDTTLFLPADSYLILSRRPTAEIGEISFESQWGNGSGIWGDHPDENYLLLDASFSLRNSSDSIKLVSALTGKSEVLYWSTSPPDGISLERVNPFRPLTEANLGYSRDETGSTPGAQNSLLPADNDLGFPSDAITLTLPTGDSDSLYAEGKVQNFGLKSSATVWMQVAFDRDFSGNISDAERIDSVLISVLMPDSTFRFRLAMLEDPGRKELYFLLPTDGDTTNNEYNFSFALGDYFTELAISEFLINPSDQLNSEWIELVNVVEYTVELDGFAIGDLERSYQINRALSISPGERLLISEDSINYVHFYGPSDCPLVQPQGWGDYRDSGDLIVLRNDLGRISDSVTCLEGRPDNQSWERDFSDSGETFKERFYPSGDSSGSTPCLPNSERSLPPENDLGLLEDQMELHVPDSSNGPVRLSITIENFGRVESELSLLRIYDDRNDNDYADDNELVDELQIPPLPVSGNTTVNALITLASGRHRLLLLLSSDQNNQNNFAHAIFTIGPITREVIITEFLADPQAALECEWVEIRNNSSSIINLNGWQFGDSLRQYSIDSDISIVPNEYLILTQTKFCFIDFYGADCRVVEPLGWNNLNNSGDALILRDEFGTISDSLSFSAGLGGNRSFELNEAELHTGLHLWLGSTSEDGSTPCEQNSVSNPIVPKIEIELHDRVFSPLLDEKLNFTLEVPPAVSLTIEIFDLAGRRHFLWADNRQLSSGEYSYAGESDYFSTLPVGAYILKISSKQANGFSKQVGFAIAAAN